MHHIFQKLKPIPHITMALSVLFKLYIFNNILHCSRKQCLLILIQNKALDCFSLRNVTKNVG